jgi:hypothetical protein
MLLPDPLLPVSFDHLLTRLFSSKIAYSTRRALLEKYRAKEKRKCNKNLPREIRIGKHCSKGFINKASNNNVRILRFINSALAPQD